MELSRVAIKVIEFKTTSSTKPLSRSGPARTRDGDSLRLAGYHFFYSQRQKRPSWALLAIRSDLTYIEHAVAPDNVSEYVCVTVKSGTFLSL